MEVMTEHKIADRQRRESWLAELREICLRCDAREPGDIDRAAELCDKLGLSLEWVGKVESQIRERAENQNSLMSDDECAAANAEYEQRKNAAVAAALAEGHKLGAEIFAAIDNVGMIRDAIVGSAPEHPGFLAGLNCLREGNLRLWASFMNRARDLRVAPVAPSAAHGQADFKREIMVLDREIEAAFTLPADSSAAAPSLHVIGGHKVERHDPRGHIDENGIHVVSGGRVERHEF